MSILLPQRWRRQPQQPTGVDWSNPVTEGLTFGWNGASPVKSFAGGGTPGSTFLTTSGTRATAVGRGVATSSTGTYNTASFDETATVDLGELSFMFVGRMPSAIGATWWDVLSIGTSTASIVLEHQGSGVGTGGLNVYSINTTGAVSLEPKIDTRGRDVAVVVSLSNSRNRAVIAYFNRILATAAYTVSGTATTTRLFGDVARTGRQPNIDNAALFVRWNRALSDAEVVSLSNNPWQIFQPIRGIPVAFDTGGGTQTLTPSLYTNNQTFYSPTVTPGAVTLSPGLYPNQQTFYGPTVTAGAVTLQPPLVTNDQTFYGPTVVAGAVTLQPALYTNTQNFYSPTVTSTVTLQPDLYTNQQSFYSPTIAPGAVTLTPDLYINTQAFYGPTVSQVVAQTIYPDLFVNQNQFFPADVLFAGGGGTAKGGWATERRRLELSIQQRQAQQTLAQSKDKVAKKIAKRIERFVEADFQDEIDEIVALQKEFAKLEARYNNSQQLSTDLRDATKVLQEFIQDEQDAIDLLMLVQEFDARCVIEATASPNVASLMGSA